MNRNYCRPINDGTNVEYAPDMLAPKMERPTREEYLAAGWRVNCVEPPEWREGCEIVDLRYVVRGDSVYLEVTYAPAPPETKRYSKLRLILAAKRRGKWDALKTLIETAGYADEWAACQFVASDYPAFGDAVAAVVASGVLTEAEVADVLAESEDEELNH